MNPGSLQHMIPPLLGSASEKHSYNPVWWILFSATEATGALRREGSWLHQTLSWEVEGCSISAQVALLTTVPHRSPHPKGKCWASAPECLVIWAPLPPGLSVALCRGRRGSSRLVLGGPGLGREGGVWGPHLWVLYSRPSLILGVSTRDAQPGPSALKVSISPRLRQDKA